MKQDNQSSREISKSQTARLVAAVRSEQVANDVVDEQVTEFLGINRTDSRCIDTVERHGRITAGALAAETGLTTGAVTAVVDRLEVAGYLHRVRDTADRRKVFIELTPLMQTMTERLFYNMQPMYRGLMDRLSSSEVEAIIFFLEAARYVNEERARMLRATQPGKDADRDGRLTAAAAYDREARKRGPAIDDVIRSGSFRRQPG